MFKHSLIKKTDLVLITSIFLLFITNLAVAESYETKHGDFFSLLLDGGDIGINYRYLGKANYPQAQNLDKSRSVKESEFKLDAGLVQPLSSELAVPFEFGYGIRNLDGLVDNQLYNLELGSGLELFLSKNVMLKALVKPTFRGDFKDNSFSKIELLGEAKGYYRINPATILYLGLIRSQDFDDYNLLPVFGMRAISENGNIRIAFELPRYLEFSYNFDPEFRMFSNLKLEGKNYQIQDNTDLYLQQRTFGVGLEWWVLEQLSFKIEGGYLIGGEIDYNNYKDNITDTAPYVIAGLRAAF